MAPPEGCGTPHGHLRPHCGQKAWSIRRRARQKVRNVTFPVASGRVLRPAGRCSGCAVAASGSAYDPRRVQTDRRAQTAPHRARTAQRQAGGDPPPQADRPPRLRLRPALLGRLRARRGAADPLAGGRVGVPLQPLDRAGGGGPDGHRGHLLPADRARLPQRRRHLRGGQGQPGPAGGTHRRQRPPRRLRADRGRVGLHAASRTSGRPSPSSSSTRRSARSSPSPCSR